MITELMWINECHINHRSEHSDLHINSIADYLIITKPPRMKKFFLVLFLFLAVCCNAQTSTLYSGEYAYGTISSGRNTTWQYYVPANTMGVFTLKNKSEYSDFDVYIYSDEYQSYKIASGVNSGTNTELVTIPVYDYGRYVYIAVKNAGTYNADYRLYPHHVDFVAILGEAFGEALLLNIVEALFDDGSSTKENDERKRNVGRASTLVFSTLKGENLGTTTKKMIINEITNELREEFGYGFWGDVFVSFGIGVVDDTYRNYWK